jgi:hypothetical protein
MIFQWFISVGRKQSKAQADHDESEGAEGGEDKADNEAEAWQPKVGLKGTKAKNLKAKTKKAGGPKATKKQG